MRSTPEHFIPRLVKLAMEREFMRFLLAGGFAALVNFVARLLLSPFLPFGISVLLAYFVGMSVGYVLYSRYVYRAGRAGRQYGQIARFLLVNLVTAGFVVAVALGLESVFGGFASKPIAEAAAHFLAIGLGAVLNYFGHRILTFARPK